MTAQKSTTKVDINYPKLPEPKYSRIVDGLPCITIYEHQHLMRAYVDADRAMRAQQPAAGDWINDDDVNRLVGELDIALNGNCAAEKASLCDVVEQVKAEADKLWRPVLAAPAAQGDAEDAARYRWLVDYLISDRYYLDDEIIACASKQELDAVIDAAMAASSKQGANHD